MYTCICMCIYIYIERYTHITLIPKQATRRRRASAPTRRSPAPRSPPGCRGIIIIIISVITMIITSMVNIIKRAIAHYTLHLIYYPMSLLSIIL